MKERNEDKKKHVECAGLTRRGPLSRRIIMGRRGGGSGAHCDVDNGGRHFLINVLSYVFRLEERN